MGPWAILIALRLLYNKNELLILACNLYNLGIILFMLITLVLLSGEFLYHFTDAYSYQFFIIAFYIVLIKDLISIPWKWHSRGGSIKKFFINLINYSFSTMDLVKYAGGTFVLIVVTYEIFKKDVFSQLYNLGFTAFIIIILMLSILYAYNDVIKEKITKTIDKWELN